MQPKIILKFVHAGCNKLIFLNMLSLHGASQLISHLHDRHVNLSLYHSIVIGDDVVYFMLHNLSGQCIGYQQYRPFADKECRNDPKSGRYYTYCNKNNINVWGLETLSWRRDCLFLVEGIFDAVRLHNEGLPALALLANDPKQMRAWFFILRQTRTLIAVCDNDVAGKKLAKFADTCIIPPYGKDLGDLSTSQVKQLVKDFK